MCGSSFSGEIAIEQVWCPPAVLPAWNRGSVLSASDHPVPSFVANQTVDGAGSEGVAFAAQISRHLSSAVEPFGSADRGPQFLGEVRR